jgi:CheY-like chemotaxis protein
MTGDIMARKLLVADDSVTIQKVVGLTFASEDIELAYVDNGEEAIQLARQVKPDLVMADVLMPGKSGYEVCEAIKGDPELRHIPVLLLTGTFEPFDAERCRRVGADGTITKPFESQTLIQQVKQLLDRPAPSLEAAPGPAAAVSTPAQAEPASAAPEPAAAAPPPAPSEETADLDHLAAEPGPGGPDPIDLEDENFGDELLETANGQDDLEPPAGPADTPGGEAEVEFEFTRDPEEVLGQPPPDLREPPAEETPTTDGVPEPPSTPPIDSWAAPEETPVETPAPLAEGASSADDVWDLSDFEAVDESQISETPTTPEPEGADALWNEAAAEAIDIVESTNLHPEDDGFILDEDAQQDSAAARALAEDGVTPEAIETTPTPAAEAETPEEAAAIGDLGADLELEDLDEAPLETAEADAGDDSIADPPEVAPAPPEEEVSFGIEATDEALPLDLEACELSEVTLEELPELEAQAPVTPEPEPEAPAAPVEGASRGASPADTAGLLSEQTSEVVRHAVRDAVEKVTWEAYGDLSETVVRAVQEKVEKIAWEVIPQMAETIIKEEIRRLKEGDK